MNLRTKATIGINKGKELYSQQIEARDFILESEETYFALDASTGSGKSQVAMESIKPPLLYLCSSIHLEHQLQQDFPEAALIKGRSNYQCPHLGTCNYCQRTRKHDYCEYEIAKSHAKVSDRIIMNFHYFLTVANYSPSKSLLYREEAGIPKLRNIVVDEADGLEFLLTEFIAFNFGMDRLKELQLATEPPKQQTKMDAFLVWFEQIRENVGARIETLKPYIRAIEEDMNAGFSISRDDKALLDEFDQLETIQTKSNFLGAQDLLDSSRWTYHSSEKAVSVKPKWLSRSLADKFLLQHGEKFLFMSATLPPKGIFCQEFGIKNDELAYKSLPSPFPKENRRIIYVGSYSISHRNGTPVNTIRSEVARILQKDLRRGLIHSVSFKLGELLEGLSPRLIIHSSQDKKSDKEEKFKRFQETEGAVLVSPSCVRGIDLPDDAGRFTIILKCPFLDLSDYHTKIRTNTSGSWGQIWYASMAVQNVQQGCGRIVRHLTDYGTSWILDKNVGRLLTQYRKLWKPWFLEAVEIEEK